MRVTQRPRVIALKAGHGQGKVAARTRVNSGDSRGTLPQQTGAPLPLLTLQAVAESCSCSYWTVRGWVDAGKLPVLRLPGRLVRVEPAELARFLEGCR
jgi:excisionase family DNA binding protein